MINLNQIHSFLAITKTLNFTAAARQLGIPQSTISRQINDLEGQLDVRLFYRTKRDVALTDEGRTFLPFAKEIAEAAEKGSRAVRELHDGAVGRLSIAVVPAAERIICRCLEPFHRQYPDIVVDIDLISAGQTIMDEVDPIYDFCFIYSDMLMETEEYESMNTHRETMGIALSRELLDSLGGAKKAVEEIPSADVILISEEADPIVYMQAMNYCRTRRFTPRVANSFSDIPSLVLALKSGMGISFLPESIISDEGEGSLAFVPLDDKSYTIQCIAAWKKSLLNPAAGLFLDVIKEQIGK